MVFSRFLPSPLQRHSGCCLETVLGCVETHLGTLELTRRLDFLSKMPLLDAVSGGRCYVSQPDCPLLKQNRNGRKNNGPCGGAHNEKKKRVSRTRANSIVQGQIGPKVVYENKIMAEKHSDINLTRNHGDPIAT